MKNQNLNLKNLYRLPWTTYDNPLGWIEPTTNCQLACPGCYRGLSQPNPEKKDQDFEKLKKEIDNLIEIKKIKVIQFTGGEPLLYPKFDQLITYARSKKLYVGFITNGIALTEKRLRQLKKLGVMEIIIHIAIYQNRGNWKNEKELNQLREKYCEMFRRVGGIYLGFIMTVSKNNFPQLPPVTDFYKKNSDILGRIYFSTFQDFFFKTPKEENKKNHLEPEKLIKFVKKTFQIEPCAYIPKKLNPQKPAWLFFAPIYLGQKIIGYADSKTAENFNQRTNNKNWSSFPVRAHIGQILISVTRLSKQTIKMVLKGYVNAILKNPKQLFKLPKAQIIIIYNLANPTPEGWDYCDGCLDTIFYKGRLVPSCLLERIKKGEEFNF